MKTFSQIAHLNNHKLHHGEDKSFPCEVCGKIFKQPNILRQHKLIYNILKAFQCSQCEYPCIQVIDLTRHNRKHTKEKPHQYTVLYKSILQISRAKHLKRHKLTHMQEKPHNWVQLWGFSCVCFQVFFMWQEVCTDKSLNQTQEETSEIVLCFGPGGLRAPCVLACVLACCQAPQSML